MVLKFNRNRSSLSLAKHAVILVEKTIKSHSKNSDALFKKLNSIKEEIYQKILTEPLLKNTISYILQAAKAKNINTLKEQLLQRTKKASEYLDNVYTLLAEYGFPKIKNGSVIYTHSYSEAVLGILLAAKKHGISFQVHVTEACFCSEGKRMAIALSKKNIPVTYYPDAALRLALKKSDIMLLGADTISESGQVYNRMGSELAADIANKYDVPVYICMPTWKFNPKIINEFEGSSVMEHQNDVWKKPPKGIIVANYKYEKINPKLITGIITEMGIYKPHHLISELKKSKL